MHESSEDDPIGLVLETELGEVVVVIDAGESLVFVGFESVGVGGDVGLLGALESIGVCTVADDGTDVGRVYDGGGGVVGVIVGVIVTTSIYMLNEGLVVNVVNEGLEIGAIAANQDEEGMFFFQWFQ